MRRLLLALALVLVLPVSAEAATINVAPGGNLTTAYNQAASGDTIQLACGNYGGWTTPDGTKTVTVKAATQNCAKLNLLLSNASNITYDGLDLDAGGGCPNGCQTALFEAGGSDRNVTFKNGRIGNVGGQKGAFLTGDGDPSDHNITLQNNLIHDVRFTSPEQHLECIMSHSPGANFIGNTFRNCGYSAISLGTGTWWNQPQYGGVVLENNVFEHTLDGGNGGWHWASMQWYLTRIDNARVVNNTFEQVLLMDRAAGGSNSVWANNLGGGWSCVSGVTYAGNVGQKCGATDVAHATIGGPGNVANMAHEWVNRVTSDFHLASGAHAINAGSAQYAPALDKDGKARVGAPDAGAYEFGGSTPPPSAVACNDGVDNDGDTWVDFPADLGCTSATDTDEAPKDTDKDTVPDAADNCPNVANTNQNDGDRDGIGNVCDNQDNADDDNDGVQNHADDCPATPAGTAVDVDGCPVVLPAQCDELEEEVERLGAEVTRLEGVNTELVQRNEELADQLATVRTERDQQAALAQERGSKLNRIRAILDE